MVTKLMLNTYSRLKMKVVLIHRDICFLRRCLKNKVTPKFVKVKCVIENPVTNKVKDFAQKKWIREEIKYLFAKLHDTELKAYNLHLKITKDMHITELEKWYEFENNVHKHTHSADMKKKNIQNKKFQKLLNEIEQADKIQPPKILDDFVINLSTERFNENELNLLNRGINFTPTPKNQNIFETIIDIETILKFKLPSVQHTIREVAKDIIMEEMKLKRTKMKQRDDNNTHTVIDSLKKKNVVYVKADKGNKLAILDKTDYDDRVHNLIRESEYKKIKKDPLPSMIRQSDKVRKQIGEVFGSRTIRFLNVSNPKVAVIYCLPKIHKEAIK